MHVWDYSFDTGSSVVDVYVGYVRRKLIRPGLPSTVETVRGAGYRFVAAKDPTTPVSGEPVPTEPVGSGRSR